jgi:hypothetical protein
LVEPQTARHHRQILDALRRFEAPARPLGPGEELIVIRRRKPAAEIAAELGLPVD